MLQSLDKKKLKHFSYAVVANYKADTLLTVKVLSRSTC